jgi:hypothetical protein
MARINLSLPDALKDQLDAEAGVNWSAVAQHAFEWELEQRSWMKMDGLQQNIERLRASKAKAAGEDFEAGKVSGRRWALESAEWRELHNLYDFAEEGAMDSLDDGTGTAWYTAYGILHGEETVDNSDAMEFWEAQSGDRRPSDAFVQGFVTACNEVSDAV